MAQDLMALQLSDFDISPQRGFLPHPDPITILPFSEIFSPLEHMANKLPKLLAARAFRKELDRFSDNVLCPVAQKAHAIIHTYVGTSAPIIRRTKVIFDYLGQAYVWGENSPPIHVPPGFAQFWCCISEKINLPPVLSYNSYILSNWHRLDPNKPIALGNIATTQNFLGGLDEDWFILVHIDIEQRAGIIPWAIIRSLQATANKSTKHLETYLSMIEISLKIMLQTLSRMPESCDEYIYYTRVRPYLHGWKNNPALPDGLLYQGVTSHGNKPQQFRGESGAQSAIVPSLVAALDIRHTETTFSPYLKEMHAYMPRGHRRFIETVEQFSQNGNSILDFVIERKQSNPRLYTMYRGCRQALYNFRRKHYEYVWRYINSQNQEHAGNPTSVGTAGTPFMTSLKQLMDETWFE